MRSHLVNPYGGDASESATHDERRAAERAALRILGAAAQSESALRRRLVRRGFSAEAADAAVAAAASAGYADDAALARSIVDRRRGRRGAVRIAAELRARGIDGEVVDAAVRDVSGEEERESALREARRRAARGLSDDPAERRRELGRIGGALSRLGFGGAVVAHALAAIGTDTGEDC